MFNHQTLGAEHENCSVPTLKGIKVFLLLILSMTLNVIAAYYSSKNELLSRVSDFNVQRPEVLVGIILIFLSIMAIIFYAIFTLVSFKIIFFFTLKDQNMRKNVSNFLLLYTLYGYLLVSVWNVINQFVSINMNPLLLKLPLSNIISYLFIGVLIYKLLVPRLKVFIAPLFLITSLTLINMIGEFFK